MKQQAIKEKLQRSFPEKQSKHPENYASTFCPPSSEIDAGRRSEQSDILWPTPGSKVRVRLDADSEIWGVVMGDEAAAAELRLSGLIGVQTEDGHFIEVPHPDENIIVTHNYDTPASFFSVSRKSTGLDVNLTSTSASQGSETTITMSSWHLEQHGSDWMNSGRTPIGKRLSSNSEMRAGNTSSETYAFTENCDDNDDVEWVDGIEGLSAKAKKRKIRGANGDEDDDSDDSDEEEVHWQTPNDSAEIDIEVMNCYHTSL
jgi:hypothetical protein